MAKFYRWIAVSNSRVPVLARRIRRSILEFTLPAPKLLVRSMVGAYVAVRSVWFFVRRVFFAEPIFKGYCKSVGRGVRTDIYPPFVTGVGDLIVGDEVLIDGRILITFSARFSSTPLLTIGDRTHIGHDCSFVVATEVSVGKDCLIASEALVFDSSGHPTDPEKRLAGQPPEADAVRPIRIEDNVWIGKRAMIFPGVTIGTGSVVAAGSIVMRDVPPFTVVSNTPARPSIALRAYAPAP